MNVHKNARLTFARRMELVTHILGGSLSLCAAASADGISLPSVRKWVGRYLAEGEAGLVDRSSRPKRSPWAIAAANAVGVVELRRWRLTHASIAASLGVSCCAALARTLSSATCGWWKAPTNAACEP
jgi:transposase